MSAVGQISGQIINNLRLNVRSRMAMIYGFLFPLIFLAAFRALYSNDRIPLLLHMGQLLTVTVLGGACFGLPTTLVSERERGVWRRYRLSPAPAWVFVAGVLATRYLLLLVAAVLQVALAMAIGMTAPTHPWVLLVAFTVAAVAFLGLGMVIAMLVDSVPAVQALGQCIFLPMLMIGGVAVRLSSLPQWAVHVSAFFPGRYAVEAIQGGFTAAAPDKLRFDLAALGLIGIAGLTGAICTFRWNPRERSADEGGRYWLALAIAMWVAVGVTAERQGRVAVPALTAAQISSPQDILKAAPSPQSAQGTSGQTARPATSGIGSIRLDRRAGGPSSWQQVTEQDLRAFAFERLPSDDSIISPIAHSGETWDPSIGPQLEQIHAALATWAPGRTADLVQRVRNDLYVAAVPDVLQMEQLERFVPLLVFSRLQSDVSPGDLPRILCWIALHPAQGDDSAVQDLAPFGLPVLSGPTTEVRNRVALYALKLLGRLTGQLPG